MKASSFGSGVSVLVDRRSEIATPEISVVIPCKNEAAFLPLCLASIHSFMPSEIAYEIIVVDNHSVDASERLAAEHGADLVVRSTGRVGRCRNVGAGFARGAVIVFLDADVVLTSVWLQRARDSIGRWLAKDEPTIWGSWYATRANGTWIERAWFEPLRAGVKTHLPGGHMIMRADTFGRLDGFDERLETGEDYELCLRATQRGISFCNDPTLEVIHLGYPRDLRNFFKREVWHGLGDAASWRSFVSSKVAVSAAISVHVSALGLILTLFFPQASLALIAALPAAGLTLSVRNFRWGTAQNFWEKWMLAQVYLLARVVSLYSGRWTKIRPAKVPPTAEI